MNWPTSLAQAKPLSATPYSCSSTTGWSPKSPTKEHTSQIFRSKMPGKSLNCGLFWKAWRLAWQHSPFLLRSWMRPRNSWQPRMRHGRAGTSMQLQSTVRSFTGPFTNMLTTGAASPHVRSTPGAPREVRSGAPANSRRIAERGSRPRGAGYAPASRKCSARLLALRRPAGHRPKRQAREGIDPVTLNAAQAIVAMLKAYEVQYVFGVPGDTSIPFYEDR